MATQSLQFFRYLLRLYSPELSSNLDLRLVDVGIILSYLQRVAGTVKPFWGVYRKTVSARSTPIIRFRKLKDSDTICSPAYCAVNRVFHSL